MDSDVLCPLTVTGCTFSFLVLWISGCREQHPPYVCFCDVFAMYNEEQCRLRSIFWATYKVIVPSGPHLAKCRLCWATFRISFASQQQKQHIIHTYRPTYCTLFCIYRPRTFRMCWAYHLTLVINPPALCLLSGIKETIMLHFLTWLSLSLLIAATHRLGCGQQEHQVRPCGWGSRHYLRHQWVNRRHPCHEETGPRGESRVHANSPGR